VLEPGGAIGAGDGVDERKHAFDQLLPRLQVARLGAAHEIAEIVPLRAQLRGSFDLSKQLGDVGAAGTPCGVRERLPDRCPVFVHRIDRATNV